MTSELLLHFEESLDAETREDLIARLADQLGVSAETHQSEKPHLMFLPTDPERSPPHRVLAAVREQGYHVRIVDL
ncbi:hypothetical protein [Imhoffiella purpurea]|uniref:YcaO domain-containing protein n=1 Tax=Imhoffiella purpurea TaxID=1249627 RepID=W9V914_9GAMM|nr:hypothetical protein [Imhoffiella purpurea]EXJ15919.1 hypothetical protein D779_0783 [Imhoffiella purpurea]